MGGFVSFADGVSVNAICAEASVYLSMSAEVVYGYCELAVAVVWTANASRYAAVSTTCSGLNG